MEKPINELLEFSIINVDKPAGITSFVCADRVRRILGAKKTGHFGTLDPMVTGVLPVAINRSCKLAAFLMKKDKEYIGKMILHKDATLEELENEMKNFIGKIMQKPPQKSRVKRVLRERQINSFKILKKEGKIVEFSADVEAGTYIRKLVHDLGEKLGGAQMIELRRVRAGFFLEKESYTLEEIKEAFEKYKNGEEKYLRKILIPSEEIIKKVIPKIQAKKEMEKSLLNGKPILECEINLPDNELFSIFSDERFIGIYKKTDEGSIVARPEFVFN